jgi:3-isopropylmalate/(R)-2-methylmalate dehydratase small subunit
MEPFRIIKSKATPLDMVNVDTDQIIPKQFLKLVQKSGYGRYLFYDWRFDKDGRPKSNFVLNDPKYTGRQILLTRDNFGSGSSREHAAWAILDYGFRAVIAPSFADIFYNNCFKNGILPVRLSHEEVDFMFINADDVDIEIDLSNQQIIMGPKSMNFEIDESRKNTLLEGLDEIGITLQFDPQITEYERRNSKFIAPYY